jgi:hypothetical protein
MKSGSESNYLAFIQLNYTSLTGKNEKTQILSSEFICSKLQDKSGKLSSFFCMHKGLQQVLTSTFQIKNQQDLGEYDLFLHL